MKKILSVLLTLTMLFSLSTTALATEKDEYSQIVYINEYDYIVALQEFSDEELKEIGMTKFDVDKTVDAFYAALNERAKLPDETLIGFGYTDEEIAILRSQNDITYSVDSYVLSAEQMRAITGTCTGNITSSYLSTRYADFKYSWSWDHSPLMTLSDSAAVRWLAYTSSGSQIDVTNYYQDIKIKYYWNTTYKFQRSGTQEPNLEFNSINVQFPVTENFISSTGLTESAYAKEGEISISVKVEPEVTSNISYMKVAALYGHTTIGVGSPSISLSPTGGISISFSGNTSINPIAGSKVKITLGSRVTSPVVTTIN